MTEATKLVFSAWFEKGKKGAVVFCNVIQNL